MVQQLQVEMLRQGCEVALSGRLDAHTAAVARALLAEMVDGGEGDLMIRASDLEIWDASGLGVLIGAHRRARQSGRRLVLLDVPPRQLRLLRAMRLHRLLTLEPAVA